MVFRRVRGAPLFIRSSVDGRLGRFRVLAAVRLGCTCLFELGFCLGVSPGVGLLDRVETLFLVF